jgi:xylulokinase
MAAALGSRWAWRHRRVDRYVGTVFGVSDRPSADTTGAVAGFADATGRYLPLVCTLNAAKVLDAVRGLLGVDPVEFDRLAMAATRALTLLPYFDGERTPTDRTPPASSAVAHRRHTGAVGARPPSTASCADCSTGRCARRALRVERIVLTGGGARSAAVRAVFAGLCDRRCS